MESWPLTINGKVDRARLPAPDRMGYDSAPPFAPPQGEIEEAIARIWAEVLGRTGIGAQDDLFCLGGHSLRAAQVVSRLNVAFQVALSVRTLFEHPTVTALAREIERTAKRSPTARPATPLVRAPRQPYRAAHGVPARSAPPPRK